MDWDGNFFLPGQDLPLAESLKTARACCSNTAVICLIAYVRIRDLAFTHVGYKHQQV